MTNPLKLMTLAACLAFCACGGSTPKPPDSPAEEGAEKSTSEKAEADIAAGDKSDAAEGDKSEKTSDKDKGKSKKDADAAPVDCSKDMFKKYGEAGFLKVNDAIIAKAVAAPVDKVGPTFKKLAKHKGEAARVKKNLAALLVKVYGGPDNYKGKDMETAHKGLKITSDQYDWFIGNVVVPALKENGVSEDDIKNCFAPPVTDAAFKDSIVGK